MSICKSCRYGPEMGEIAYCGCESAMAQLVKRTIFHENRTRNYQPEFKRLTSMWAMGLAQNEMQSCAYYRKRLFMKRTETEYPGGFNHPDVKDTFRVKRVD
ncbi:MAG: hypothetical protein LLG08_03160 [Actinomycetia bacterium]|nr:hypothetical protein [Actinomycetes bacterium]